MNQENRETLRTILYVAGLMVGVTGFYHWVKNHPPAFLENLQYPPKRNAQEAPKLRISQDNQRQPAHDIFAHYHLKPLIINIEKEPSIILPPPRSYADDKNSFYRRINDLIEPPQTDHSQEYNFLTHQAHRSNK